MSPGPQRFRKQPVEVEAMQWDGSRESIQAICDWANHFGERVDDPPISFLTDGQLRPFDVLVETLNGDVRITPGEWVVRGVSGEFYPITDEILRATHEPVEGGPRIDPATGIEEPA